MSRLLPLLGVLLAATAVAAPHAPGDDATVLERLPSRPGDPVAAELRALRSAAAAAPGDASAAARLARRYFDLALAHGDARYIGYAEAALRAWQGGAEPPVEVLVVQGLLRQYRHDFDGALALLARAAARDPGSVAARSWSAAIHMVRADYARARRECEALEPIASELLAAGCAAYVDATTGRARAAYQRLSALLERDPEASAGLRLWAQTRLAEAAWRFGDAPAAERHFRAALALGLEDNFLLAAYADFLLEHGRDAEVPPLLRGRARSDTLLLRLALAAQALGLAEAQQHIKALGERFAAAALRGERLHMGEEARYLLHLRGDARGALALAAENWKAQREPRDAAILLEAALAARDPQAAAPALEWLEASGFEHDRLRRVGAQLKALAR
jgi:Tfp pilus assembly protein PilF